VAFIEAISVEIIKRNIAKPGKPYRQRVFE
jgi:hypothetical protein